VVGGVAVVGPGAVPVGALGAVLVTGGAAVFSTLGLRVEKYQTASATRTSATINQGHTLVRGLR
jgi:hypothetical protein